MHRILIVSGGSGGHLFPAISLADDLRKRGKQVILTISSKDIDKKIIKERDYEYEVFPLFFFLSKNPFLSLIKFLASFRKAERVLRRYKPAVVVGMGGGNSISPLLLAHFRGIPTLIHEQNVFPGKANRFLSNFVDRIAISFAETKKFFPSQKVVFTGNPLRKEVFEKGEREKQGFTILIMGGSQGAHSINTLSLSAFRLMSEKEKKEIEVIHLSGEKDYIWVSEEYKNLRVKHSVFSFFSHIGNLYSSADLLISRAGATTIAEIIASKKPAILIPYPYASYHQRANANFLFKQGACLMIEEDRITPEELKKTILYLKEDKRERERMRENLKRLYVQGADRRLGEQVIGLIRKD